MEKTGKLSKCVKGVGNFGTVKNHHLFDHKTFNKDLFSIEYPIASPKLHALIKNIKRLDEMDYSRSKQTFKHMIYTDVDNSRTGVKVIASALSVEGFVHCYTPMGTGFHLKTDEELLETRGQNFGVMISKSFFDRNVSVRLKKQLIAKYNDRDGNVNGDYLRIIVLDQGYKEGIDLFDVKYVHLFDPVLDADQKQAVGRGTRYCGQMGLAFHPVLGWPLHVFKYDNEFDKPFMGTQNIEELWLKSLNLDIRRIKFAANLEDVVIDAAVDRDLTKALHTFSINNQPLARAPSLKQGGANKKAIQDQDSEEIETESEIETVSEIDTKNTDRYTNAPRRSQSQSQSQSEFLDLDSNDDMMMIPLVTTSSSQNDTFDPKFSPRKKMNLQDMRQYIWTHFRKYAYPSVKLEDKCRNPFTPTKDSLLDNNNNNMSDSLKARMVSFNPTQQFVRHFFNPNSAYKGMLLYHSVGTGKTCTAIATASSSFQKMGYNIIYVTRHTLKQDVWKNIVGQVCHQIVREKVAQGDLTLPTKVKTSMVHAGKEWLMPMSYKQFTNLLNEKNKFYTELVKRNGKEDPLKKTLVIIDEAHKLYSAGSVSSAERPNMNILEKWINQSYQRSKQQSVRLLLMTGTPFVNDGMEMINLLNMLREPDEKLPVNFEDFMTQYLDPVTGVFTTQGETLFKDQLSGYISYLNRSRDGRTFAQPVLHNISVKVTPYNKEKGANSKEKRIKELKKLLKQMQSELKAKVKLAKASSKAAQKGCKDELLERARTEYKMKKEAIAEEISQLKQAYQMARDDQLVTCKQLKLPERKTCTASAREEFKSKVERMKEQKKQEQPVTLTEYLKRVDISACVDIGDKDADSIRRKYEQELEALQTEYDELNDDVGKQLEELKLIGNVIKDAIIDAKEAASLYKELKSKYKTNLAKIKRQAKLDKNESRVQLRQLQASLGKQVKSAYNDYQNAKARVSELKSRKIYLKLLLDKTQPDDFSPYTALRKRCYAKSTFSESSDKPRTKSKSKSKSKTKTRTPDAVMRKFYVGKIQQMSQNGPVSRAAILLTFHPDKLPLEVKQLYAEDPVIREKIDAIFRRLMEKTDRNTKVQLSVEIISDLL